MKKPLVKIPNTFYRASVKAYIPNSEGGFLLLQEDDGFWELAGGGIDFGETPRQALEREIAEETGLVCTSISKQPLRCTTFKNRYGVWFVNIVYTVALKDLQFRASEECCALGYFTPSEVLKHPQMHANVKLFARTL